MTYTRLRAAAIITSMSIVSGAIAGTLVAFIIDFSFGAPHIYSLDLVVVQVGAMIGGVFGIFLGPAAAFGFLRRVPIGRLFGQTILGAVCGTMLGFGIGRASHLFNGFVWILGGGMLGFCLAAARLWWRFRESSSRSPELSASEPSIER
jgi:hypothetical protein